MAHHSSQWVQKKARETIGLDEQPDTPLPQFYVDMFTKHIQKYPNDVNFIVELADPTGKDTSVGGNGFGVITCMDDHCWKEILLSADPFRPDRDGGRKDGFGSFYDYQEHCKEADHVAGRNERCKRMGIPINVAAPKIKPLVTPASRNSYSSSFGNASAGPSQSSSKGKRASIFDTLEPSVKREPNTLSSPSVHVPSSPVMRNAAAPQRDVKPLNIGASSSSSSRAPAASITDLTFTDSDDSDVVAIAEKDIPEEYRKHTNRDNPILLSDDEMPSSSAASGKGKAATRGPASSSASRPPLAPIFTNQKKDKITQAQIVDDDEDIEQQEATFSQLFAPKREPSPEPARAPVPPTMPNGQVVRSSVAGPSSAPAQVKAEPGGNRLPPSFATTLAELRAGAATGQNEIVPATDTGRNYLAERLYLLKNTMALAGDQTKLIPVLNRLDELKTLRAQPSTAPYSRPGLPVLTVFPSLMTHIEIGRAQLVQMPSGILIKDLCRLDSCRHPYNAPGYTGIGAAVPANAAANPYQPPGIGGYGGPGAYGHDSQDLAGVLGGALGMGGMGMWDEDDERSYDSDEEYDSDDPFSRRRFGNPYGFHDMGLGEGMTPSMFARPAMPVEGLTQFFKDNLKDFVEDTTVDEALSKLNLNSLGDYLPGLKIQLMPHQVMGVTFMLEHEKDDKCRGGILADAMGLGKTVQSIALMAANQSQDKACRTTLIVAPLALLTQWKAEIETKTTEGLMKVLIYHGQKRIQTVNNLKQYDVVLTTYGTLTSESATEPKTKKKKANADGEPLPNKKKQGPLAKMKWYRVILDEAHQIRNKSTRVTKAAFGLDSHLRWSLTGTLVVNTLDDIWPHLHFLNISPSAQWDIFRDSISRLQKKDPKRASDRVQAILRTCCIRRNKESTLNGRKLLELPPKSTVVTSMAFTDEERQIYTAIENRFQIKFNSFLRKGTVMKHYSIMLVMLLRLRQLTCHPWLLRRDPSEGGDDRDVLVTNDDLFGGIDGVKTDDVSELARAQTLCGKEYVDRVTKILTDRKKLLETAPEGDETAAQECECSVCFDEYTDERVTPCCHSFCATCLEDIFNAPTGNADLSDEDVTAGRRKCPLCRTVIDKSKIFRAEAFLPKEEEDDEDEDDDWGSQAEEDADDDEGLSEKQKGKRKAVDGLAPKKKKKAKGMAKIVDIPDEPLGLQDADGGMAMEDVMPSTKMRKLGELIDGINDEDPSQKIIVFSQFVQYIELCSMFLNRRGVKHVRYVGSMKQDEREETIKVFNRPADEPNSPKVILMSLKCGGVGLNLCVANHVICLDLAWNAATENQAVDRSHRIGQRRPVTVHRLTIEDTVEQRIMDLQNQKQALSDGAMGEGTGGRLGRLSVNDLIKLFGVGRD
ncbi:hypothetical protein IAT38_000207 [Cryptococcus sp. DSM 104549]